MVDRSVSNLVGQAVGLCKLTWKGKQKGRGKLAGSFKGNVNL